MSSVCPQKYKRKITDLRPSWRATVIIAENDAQCEKLCAKLFKNKDNRKQKGEEPVPFLVFSSLSKEMATAAMATTTSSASSSISSTTNGSAGSSTSSSNSKIIESQSSGYISHQSSNSSAGLSVGTPRARRGRQSSSIFPCSGSSHYTLSSGNSLSTKLSGNRRDSGPLSLFKMRGLKRKTFYENSTVLSELNSSDSEDNRKKQNSINFPHSSSINYSMTNANSSQGTISKLKRDSVTSSFNLFKMRGLRWKSFYDNTGVLSELNSSDSEDTEKNSMATVMRLDKSDMGLYGLRPETDPFYAVVCSICNAIIKPQGLQKHMVNRHNAHHHANHNYHTTSSHHSAANCNLLASSSSSISGQFDRSSEHHFLSQTVSSSSSSVGVSTGIGGAGNSSLSNNTSNTVSNFISSGSSYTSGSRSKSRSTSKIKAKSGKSSSPSSSSNHHNPNSNISSTTAISSSSSSSGTVSFPVSSGSSVQRNVHNASSSTPSGHTTSSGSASNSSFGSGANTSGKSNSSYHQSVAITATNTTSHSAASSGRSGHTSVQKTDSNSKQIKPPFIGAGCLSSLSNTPQHMQSQGGNPSKGMVIPTLSEASLSSNPESSGSSSGSSTASSNSSISSNSSSSSLAISSSSSSSLSSSSLASTTRRTYGRSSKTITSERKNLPVKDREYDADKHCGVLAGEPPKPCTRSLTCKSHSLTMRRLVNGRTKSFDKLLSDHRTTKESTRSSSNSLSRAIPEFESSNSSSSIEMDRRSSQSVSSNSNLSTEAQPHSSSSSMSPIPPMTSTSGNDGTPLAGISSITSSNQNSGHSFGGSTRRVISSTENRRSHTTSSSSSSVDIREVTETVRSTSGKLQLNLSRVDCPRVVGERGSSVRSTGSTFPTNRHRGVPADNDADNGTPNDFLITTRMIEAERSAIPPELLDDRNFQRSVFSPESTVLKRPIRLLIDEDPEEYKRARTIDNDIDLMDISKERKLQLKIQHRVQTKNKYRFRAPGEPSQYALSMPPAAAAVAKLFVQNNPNATVTNAQFVLDPETNIVSVSMNGTFDPKDLRVNWSRLERKFLEKTIIDSLKPYGVTVDEKGYLVIPKREFYIPNPEDEGFRIHHHKPMTEEEYARLRPEFINGMPKPIRCGLAQGGVKTEIKDEHDPIDTSHLPPILPGLHKDLRNIKMEIKQEIKQEIKDEPMNEDEMLEYCQPANCLKINENYNEMSNEIASIDPISFQVPAIETRNAIIEQKSQHDLISGEIIQSHGFKNQIKEQNDLTSNSLPRNGKIDINQEIKQEIKEEPMNEDEMLEYCQPANCLKINENYSEMSNEIASIDPISFQVPTIETRTTINEQKSQHGLISSEIIESHGYSQNNNNSPEYRERDNELPHPRTVRNMLGHRPKDQELLASADEISSNYTVTSNEISINIPLFEMSTEGISNAISAITAIELPKIISQDSNIPEVVHQQSKTNQEIRRNITGQITEIIEEPEPIFMENITPSSPTLPPPVISDEQEQPQQSPVEPMSVMTDEDEELAYDKNNSYFGIVEAISTSNSRNEQIFSSQQEKENTKLLIDSNFYDTYPFSDDVMHGLKTWHTTPPKPLSVNTFGLVKIRGGTNFKKNVITMRKTKSSIQSYHFMKKSNAILFHREKQNDCNIRNDINNGNLDQMGNIIKYNVINRSKRNIGNHSDELLLWALRMQLEEQLEEQLDDNVSGVQTGGNSYFKQCNSTNGSRPRLEKKSIIMHKVHMNKTCKALRSNIVGKLSEQLLGFKKYNNSGKNTSSGVSISGSIGGNQQIYANINGRCCGSSSSKLIQSNSNLNSNSNATINRSTHSEGSSNKIKNRNSNGNNSRSSSNGGSSTGNSVFLGSSSSQQHHIGGGNTTNHNSGTSVRYSNSNVLNHFRMQSSGGTQSSSSSTSSSTSGSTSKGINNGNSTNLTSIGGQPSSSISSSSSSSSSSSRSVLSNHHRNGTEYN